MTTEDIFNDVVEKYSEYIEMSDNPHAFVSGVLVKKVQQLQSHVQYLEKRINAMSNIPRVYSRFARVAKTKKE